MKREIWDSLLDADLNVRYWGYLSRRYYLWDRYSKVFLAVMSSGTVASWGIWDQIPLLWKGLSSVSALTAIALPLLDFSKMIKRMIGLKQKWTELRAEYELIWMSYRKGFPDNEIERTFRKTKQKETKVSGQEYNLPRDRKLLYRCREEVLKSRGINAKKEAKNG